MTSGLPFIRSGRLIPLAVSTARRSSILPEVPTNEEAGVPNSDYTFWNGMLAPAKTPADIVKRLHDETMRVLTQPAVADRLKPQGLELMPLTPGRVRRADREGDRDQQGDRQGGGVEVQLGRRRKSAQLIGVEKGARPSPAGAAGRWLKVSSTSGGRRGRC